MQPFYAPNSLTNLYVPLMLYRHTSSRNYPTQAIIQSQEWHEHKSFYLFYHRLIQLSEDSEVVPNLLTNITLEFMCLLIRGTERIPHTSYNTTYQNLVQNTLGGTHYKIHKSAKIHRSVVHHQLCQHKNVGHAGICPQWRTEQSGTEQV